MPRINSRSLDDLEPNVSVNAKNAIAECKSDLGLIVGIACTYRNQEEQTYLAQTKGAPKLVSFHAARLAFDIFQNIKGKEYDDAFFNKVAVIFKKYGFSWMYDIKKYDKCHFQWDNHGLINGTLVRQGMMPPPMPIYKAQTKAPDYKAIIKKHVTYTDATWQFLDKHPYPEAFFKAWAESYK